MGAVQLAIRTGPLLCLRVQQLAHRPALYFYDREGNPIAAESARSDGLLLDSYRRPDEFYRLKYSMLEERLEQVREIDGELAYEKMRRAVEKARQVERARLEWARQETARQSRDRRGPERGGPERDFGPSR